MSFSLNKFRTHIREIQRNQYFEVRFFVDGDYIKFNSEDDDYTAFTFLTRTIDFEKGNIIKWKLLQASEEDFWNFVCMIQKTKQCDNMSMELMYLKPDGSSVGKIRFENIVLKDFDPSGVSVEGGSICDTVLYLNYVTKNVV